ncbi:MAG: FAD:protein FMN transferase [Candidatus Omnitrophica bacterium]|jgi:thiamine biosynthesis lipoprotein|nr:FAD:protein FMN transferase [Candidatus Omnitrophota bacterium]MDD5661368.1 FAD:protein FMN transferase [Candidatus Omnitrophota bacterium]
MAYNARIRKYLVAFLITGWAVTLLFYAAPKKKLYTDNRVLMGTFWEVKSPDKAAGRIVFEEASRIEGLLSKYLADSEISVLNRKGKSKVSPDTFYVIKKAKEFWQETDGAFDITIAPLIRLWGFADKKYTVPKNSQIKAALKLVGSDKIILHEKDNVVEFSNQGTEIDLGAIAKGFALDCAVNKLKKAGINNCLINAGGQVYALGSRFGKPWKIAIKNAQENRQSNILELSSRSASTSGDYEQFFFKEGRRYIHIINPKTGLPVDSGTSSVTVVDKSALVADALSTAFFILEAEGRKNLEAKFPKTQFYLN